MKVEVLTCVSKVVMPKFYTWNVTKYDANFTITTSSPSAKINKHLHMFGEVLQVQQYCARVCLPDVTNPYT
jgi:hypothetical protein